MPKLQIRYSSESGRVPTVEELSEYKFGWNIHDGILYGLKKVNGVFSVVPITGGGSSSENIMIPQLQLETILHKFPESENKIADDLYGSWDFHDDSFMNYNPEIWTFRKRNNMRRVLINEEIDSFEVCEDPGCDNPSVWTLNGFVGMKDSKIEYTAANINDSTINYVSQGAHPYSWFELKFDVSDYVSGGIVGVYGENSTAPVTANGSYTFRIRRLSQFGNMVPLGIKAMTNNTSLKVDNISLKRIIRNFDATYKKKWTHEPHENGIKYPNSNFYAGQTMSKIPSIMASGRQTEFALTAGRREKQKIDLNPFEYFYAMDYSNQYFALSEETDLTTVKKLEAAGKQSLSIGFRFAIVIDHPVVPGVKLFGPLSEILYLRASTLWVGYPPVLISLQYRYRTNAVIIRL